MLALPIQKGIQALGSREGYGKGRKVTPTCGLHHCLADTRLGWAHMDMDSNTSSIRVTC